MSSSSSSAVEIYATVVFLLTWVLISPSQWAWFPLGRAGSGLFGATLMLVGGAIAFDDGMAAIGDNLEVREAGRRRRREGREGGLGERRLRREGGGLGEREAA